MYSEKTKATVTLASRLLMAAIALILVAAGTLVTDLVVMQVIQPLGYLADYDRIGMLFHLLGFAGMIGVVSAYYGLVNGHWEKDSYDFNGLNLFGGITLLISLLYHFNLGSFIIEIFWICIALQGILKKHKSK